jgi:pantoate--beta-alanine ligase
VEVLRDPAAMRELAGRFRAKGLRIGLVPTMGALHEGHLSLMRRCRAENDVAAWSLFVNPTQFGPHEDLAAYPRDPEGDMALAIQAGMDLCFAPEAAAMYPPGYRTVIEVGDLSGPLCGASRPGHFRGVASVVCKLFHIMQPHVAYFGQKDYQQSLIIRRMVRDLDFGIEIAVLPTVRAPDGLALSSRNAYLAPAERQAAAALPAALRWAEEEFARGGRRAVTLVEGIRQILTASSPVPIVIDYLEVRDADDLAPIETIGRTAVVALAVRIGRTRLIDNTLLTA